MGNSRKRIFITGIGGFIGSHLAKVLLQRGDQVAGCDNFNDYYDPSLKKERVEGLPNVFECDVQDQKQIETLITNHNTTHLVHLAAQAGVRYSITHPQTYVEANLHGLFSLLEVLKAHPQIKFTFASSSSVYGLNKKIPFSESDPTDLPANFYAATKKAGEAMAFSYHHLYGIATTALRYFTVYGPMGRPDMAYYKFAKAILEEKPIDLYNYGKMERDFTYIDDIVDGTIRALDYEAPFEIFNLGNNTPEPLLKMVELLEQYLGKKAILNLLPMQMGEIRTTFADIDKAKRLLGYEPKTSLEQGLQKFTNWFQSSNICSELEPLL